MYKSDGNVSAIIVLGAINGFAMYPDCGAGALKCVAGCRLARTKW